MVGNPTGDLIGIRTSIHFRRPKVGSHFRLRAETHYHRLCEVVGCRYHRQLFDPLPDSGHPGLMVLAQCVNLEQNVRRTEATLAIANFLYVD